MRKERTKFMKHVAMVIMALVIALTAVLVPVPAKAAASDAFVVKSYMMAKGEKWTLNVYNAPAKAKISYKSSKSSVAAVSKKGVVTAKKAGSAVITTTIKEGKKSYSAKTKVTVKSKLTAAQCVKRVNAELNLVYLYAYNLAELNGWLDDEDAAAYLVACGDLVSAANDMVKQPSAYSADEIEETIEGILAMVETMEELLPVFVQPYE